jgi:hypothetical protein
MEPEQNHKSASWPATPVVVSAVLATLGLVLFGFGWTGLLLLLAVLLLSLLCGQAMALLQKRSEPERFPAAIAQLLNLSRDGEMADIHGRLAEALETTAQLKDPIFRQLATQRLENIVQQTQTLAEGSIEYTSTESWRLAYETLLRSPGLHLYRSVAYIESAHYWQDGPGQQSTRLNLELQDSRTIRIERLAIIADYLWPEDSPFPIEPIHAWLDEQHRHGIWIRLVRESALGNEADLLTDFGIYGSRAVGIRVADPADRTIQFVLTFDFAQVERAEALWDRLAVYAVSFRDLLDQQP